MSRRGHPDDVIYQEDDLYEKVDRRRRSRDDDDRYLDSESSRRRPVAVREIDERIRRRPRDRSAPDFMHESFLLKDEDRRRDRVHPDDLRLERETEEIYFRRSSPPEPPRPRPRRVSRDEVVFEEVEDRRRWPREKEKVVLEERRDMSPSPVREDIGRTEKLIRRRDRSLPPRRARESEEIFVEDDRRRYETSGSETMEDGKAYVRGHRHHHPSRRQEDVERERIKLHRRSLPPFDDYREKIEDEEREEKVVFRHRDHSSGRRRGERLVPREEEREEEIVFEERDRDWPPHPRNKREKFVVRHEDRSRRRDEEDVDDVLIRRQSRSIPRPPLPDSEGDQDEVIFRHRHRSSPRREDDREDVVIRHRDRAAPVSGDDRDEVRIRHRHHHSSRGRDDDEDDVVVRRRSVHLDDDDREEVIVRRDKHGRRVSVGTNVEDEVIIREGGVEREDEIKFRHGRGPHHNPDRSRSRHDIEAKEEIIIRDDVREGPRGRNEVSREMIIRKDEEEESSEPPVIRKPPIVQELITHHRHIDSYETIPPPRQRGLEEQSLADVSESTERSASPRRRHSLPEEEEVENKATIITRTISGDHGRERETVIREKEREIVRKEPEEEEKDHVGRTYISVKDKRDRLWTEIAKDLVVREAIERAGYEYEETENFYYVFDYLRYNDVERLVDLSDAIRQFRRERIRDMRRERESLPRLPVIPGPPPLAPRAPLLLERAPVRESYPWESRERFRERDVIVEEGRRPHRYREV